MFRLPLSEYLKSGVSQVNNVNLALSVPLWFNVILERNDFEIEVTNLDNRGILEFLAFSHNDKEDGLTKRVEQRFAEGIFNKYGDITLICYDKSSRMVIGLANIDLDNNNNHIDLEDLATINSSSMLKDTNFFSKIGIILLTSISMIAAKYGKGFELCDVNKSFYDQFNEYGLKPVGNTNIKKTHCSITMDSLVPSKRYYEKYYTEFKKGVQNIDLNLFIYSLKMKNTVSERENFYKDKNKNNTNIPYQYNGSFQDSNKFMQLKKAFDIWRINKPQSKILEKLTTSTTSEKKYSHVPTVINKDCQYASIIQQPKGQIIKEDQITGTKDVCILCDGAGTLPYQNTYIHCSRCNKTGTYLYPEGWIKKNYVTKEKCILCDGIGIIPNISNKIIKCSRCEGTGQMDKLL
ncbi:hypothetical protein [Allofrancisella frigidaquae]|uniref:Uncharacterized protein n=1 Tax=Allofrancisella frigidaquae TaxID=1085644 RepID=A0A6M3HSP3_9GAMM|nr:hypothetical protein [Allofrancisella frigidaquae]QIV94175.1 hypothetical protein E3E15_01910 [Allofrancisella frigidaquae]